MGVLGPNQLDIKLDFDDVRFRGGCLGLGTAGMIIMNEHTNMVEALRNFGQLAADGPNRPEWANFAAGACGNLAAFRIGQRDFKAAKAFLEQAAPHNTAALKARPQHPGYRDCLRGNSVASEGW